MPAVYLVTTPGGSRLVEANSKAQAINHVVNATHSAQTLKAFEVGQHMKAGLQLETAVAAE